MAAPTVLFIGSATSAAYSPSGGFITQPTDAAGDIGLMVESLLAALPKRSKNVYVLSTEIWSQGVDIESRALRRVESSQVLQMVAYEAESLSGISSHEARTAIQQLRVGPAETNYWVSQIDSIRFAQAADAAAFSGCRLMGMLHPAGLPASLLGHKTSWSRVESWADAGLAVWRNGRGSATCQFLEEPPSNIDSTSVARQVLAASQIEPEANVEVIKESSSTISAMLVGETGDESGSVARRIASGGILDLSGDDDLQSFLAAWSAALRKTPAVPVIRPVRGRASTHTKRLVAMALVAAALVGCVAHYFGWGMLSNMRVAALEQEVAELREPVTTFAEQRKQLQKLQEDLKTASSATDELQRQVDRYQGHLGIHRSRIVGLLELLAAERPRDLVVNNIESSGDSIRIVGRGVQELSVSRFAETLAQRLQEMNLKLEMSRCEALLLTADGGPYEFEFVIEDSA